MTDEKRPVIRVDTAASMGAMVQAMKGHQAGKTDDLVGTRGVEQIAENQARAKAMRGNLKRSARKAAAALTRMGQNTIVLNHIQPRWLRAEIERRLDAGETIDEERVEQLRAIGAGRHG